MRSQVLFVVLFLSLGTFAGIQKTLENLLINLQNPGSNLDTTHTGAEHTDDKGTHWYDIIVEMLVPEDSDCDALYDSSCAALKELGCLDPCGEPSSQHVSDHTHYVIGQKCFIDISFKDEEAGAIQKFYESCEDCVQMEFDELFSVPEDEIIEMEVEIGSVTQKKSTWGLKKLQDKDYRTADKEGDYNIQRDYSAGQGVRVYVLDTGFDNYWRTNAEFENRNVAGSPSRVETGTSTVPGEGLEDSNGHGTHCAGTVGGNTYGVAAGVTIIPVKVIGRSGKGAGSCIIEGIEWSVRDCAGRKCILSMSLGGAKDNAVNDAVDEAVRSNNIPIVAAAGNQGKDAKWYSPASADKAITVGSVDRYLTKSYFSNYGTDLDIWAPGSGVMSTHLNQKIVSISGTSMACPHVSGLVAIMLAKGEADGSYDSVMAQLKGDYGVYNILTSIPATSEDLFAQQKKRVCRMEKLCDSCEINAPERWVSASYSFTQCRDACLADSTCWAIDVGKNSRSGNCWFHEEQTTSRKGASDFNGYIKKCDGGSEEALNVVTESMNAVNVANEYMTTDILINGLAFVGVASLFYLGINACQKQYQPIAEAAEV